MSLAGRAVDLNADLGEGFPWDEALLELVTSANVCCGAHAGDAETSRRAVEAAARRGVLIHAHPGYADREGFGRVPMPFEEGRIWSLVLDQVGKLILTAQCAGATVRAIKPHGALYNQAQWEGGFGAEVVAAARVLSLPVVGLPGSLVERRVSMYGWPGCDPPPPWGAPHPHFVSEGFADRRYGPDGRLVPRGEWGALLADPGEMVDQVLRLIGEGVRTICLHGDEPGCVERAVRLREALDGAGVEVRAWAAPAGG